MNSVLAGAPDVTRQSQVDAQVSRMDGALEDIERAVAVLIGRLGGVTRDEGDKNAVPMPPKEVLVPLANKLREQCEKASHLHNVINSLRERIEV